MLERLVPPRKKPEGSGSDQLSRNGPSSTLSPEVAYDACDYFVDDVSVPWMEMGKFSLCNMEDEFGDLKKIECLCKITSKTWLFSYTSYVKIVTFRLILPVFLI